VVRSINHHKIIKHSRKYTAWNKNIITSG
jgi:hypothetical protein